jgi:hypothetical protein
MGMHHQSEWGPRSEQEPRDEVHILGKNSEPFWPFLDGLDKAVTYLQKKHGIKKVDRSIVVTALLDNETLWTDEALDQLVDKVVSQLTSRLVSR